MQQTWPYRLGRLWFQNRSLSPLPFFLLFVFLPPQFRWQDVHSGYLLLTMLGVLCAESLRVYAVGIAGSATRTRGDHVPKLVHSGPYRFVRNPLYIGNILLYSLCGVMFGFIWLSLALLVFSVIQYNFIIRYEEGLLESTFGQSYRDYLAGVSRWVPTFPPYQSSGHPFDLKMGLLSEKSTFTAMGAMLLVLAIKMTWFS